MHESWEHVRSLAPSQGLKGPPRLLRCTQLFLEFFSHVLLLASETGSDGYPSQCETNTSEEESYSYVEQCSWDNLVLFPATHVFPLFNPFWRLPQSILNFYRRREGDTLADSPNLQQHIFYSMMGTCGLQVYIPPTNMPLSVEGNFQWVQRQNWACFLPGRVKENLLIMSLLCWFVPVSVWKKSDASVGLVGRELRNLIWLVICSCPGLLLNSILNRSLPTRLN